MGTVGVVWVFNSPLLTSSCFHYTNRGLCSPIVDVNEWFYACLFNEDAIELAKLSRNPSSVISQLEWCKPSGRYVAYWTLNTTLKSSNLIAIKRTSRRPNFRVFFPEKFSIKKLLINENLDSFKTETFANKLGWKVYGKRSFPSERGRYYAGNMFFRTFSIYFRNLGTFKYF